MSSCIWVQKSVTLAQSFQLLLLLLAAKSIAHINQRNTNRTSIANKRMKNIYRVHCGILPKYNVGGSNVSPSGKFDTFLCYRNHNCTITQHKTEFRLPIYDQNNLKKPKISEAWQYITSITNAGKIFTNPSKLSWRHPNNSMILSLRDSKVLTINVHQLHFKICYLILCYNKIHPLPKKELGQNHVR